MTPNDPSTFDAIFGEDRTAANWRYDEGLEERGRLACENPEEFDRTFGALGRIALGLYEHGKAAAEAAGIDTTDRSS